MTTAGLTEIPIADLKVSDSAPQKQRRKRFKKDALEELAVSIGEQGVLQNIIARTNGKGLEIVAGERRFLAAKIAGLKTIPGVVRTLSDEQVIEIQLIENLQREDIHPMEEAEGYEQLMRRYDHPIEEVYSKVGKSRSYVYGRIKLLALCDTARAAFYAGELSASTALLIARIPGIKLQRQALKDLTRFDGVSYRRAKEIVQNNYMLRLREAPFKTGDEKLLAKAGSCRTCPKRTGNQPELFGDIKGADVCTDPPCFKSKVKAHGQLLLKEAKAKGQPVIQGKAAKKVAPYGIGNYFKGYARLDEKNHSDPKCRMNKAIVGKDVETTLLQDPGTGDVIELVKQSAVDTAIRKVRPRQKVDDGTTARRKKAKTEKLFRVTLYERLRPKLKAPSMRDLAHALFDRLEHDTIKVLCTVRDFDPPRTKGYGGGVGYKDYRGIGKTIDKLSQKELTTFVNDCIFARELQVSTWSESKPERLLAAAKKHRINVLSLRRSITKKKTKKKTGKKKAAKPKRRPTGR